MLSELQLEPNEKVIFALRGIFESYGYSHYKMSKFEEYDLYSKNKDFLVSDGVITFTDTSGKLMALKPDVTLSIVKNTKDSGKSIQKLYYVENVYRVAKSSHSFKELMQVGLECIGDIDAHSVFEVLSIALKSLRSISEHSVLAVSDLGILADVLVYCGIPTNETAGILHFIGEKNIHEISKKCEELSVSEEKYAVLKKLLSFHGNPSVVIGELKDLLDGVIAPEKINSFCGIITALDTFDDILQIDFSIVDDINYYNGIVFKGFVRDVPNSVLSGGQYDTLMKRMKCSSGAVGFAVYLDELELLPADRVKNDVDIVLLYNRSESVASVEKAADSLRVQGKSVMTVTEIPEGLRAGEVYEFKNGEVTAVENNA